MSNSAKSGLSVIASLPSREPRGKHGDIYLDELAHYTNDYQIYRASTPLISRTRGQLTGCSSPLGRRGVFWEIATEEMRPYPDFNRQIVPWWLCSFFCKDTKTAFREADKMLTEERIERFGRQSIIEQYRSIPLEDFQQEFECVFVDESYSYYPYDLILPCTSSEHHLYRDFGEMPVGSNSRIVAGFDVGRMKDRSELAVFSEREGRYRCLMLRSYKQVPFAEQEADLRSLLEAVPVARLSIDKSGLGINLAENLSRDYPQVSPEIFSIDSKERWATDMKILLQRRDILLPRDREIIGQIHSIKRRVLPSGKVSFDAKQTRDGHADKFWAIALACQKERGKLLNRNVEVSVRVFG